MYKNRFLEFNNKESVSDVLKDLLRNGALKLIHQAAEAKLCEYLFHNQRVMDNGMVALVCNGYLPKREILNDLVYLSPKVISKDGALNSLSALVPPYVRKTRSLEAALPRLYLKGVSTGERGEALKVLVGHYSQGLSASTVLTPHESIGE